MFNHSFINGHLGCLHFLAIVNKCCCELGCTNIKSGPCWFTVAHLRKMCLALCYLPYIPCLPLVFSATLTKLIALPLSSSSLFFFLKRLSLRLNWGHPAGREHGQALNPGLCPRYFTSHSCPLQGLPDPLSPSFCLLS